MTPLGWLGRKTSTQANKQIVMIQCKKSLSVVATHEQNNCILFSIFFFFFFFFFVIRKFAFPHNKKRMQIILKLITQVVCMQIQTNSTCSKVLKNNNHWNSTVYELTNTTWLDNSNAGADILFPRMHLIHCSLETLKRITDKQCRSRSHAEERGVWSESHCWQIVQPFSSGNI